MVRTKISDDDEGKRVVNSRGKKIGMVTEVKNGTAYVDPDPGIADSIRSRLGWGDADDDNYELESRRIDRITDDEIHLKN
ncbi:PRC-barrel domain containing protein [Halorubrum sp. AD140]|uniref:PRC-barrel domain containing protein n=1 Tax=Halorubrum sp. AD140 TaxID=3050073 RepID=UPI002ACCC7E8|nr:PRC-barrel domain containing protein [Halorubrum sp. AD140]MDZ5810630.1 PRC-barrel domain containing protein [Halorubrum sp. AD140]